MTHRRFWIYFILFLLNAICYVDRMNMSVSGHTVATEFHLSPIQLGYLFAGFSWTYVVMLLPSGRLVDGLGVHRMAWISATVWSVAQALGGAAVGFTTLMLTRLGLGVGEAPAFPMSYRAVRDWGPASERGRAVGVIAAGALLGPGLAAPAVAWLIHATSWRWSFLATGLIGLVWVVIWKALVSTPERTPWIPEPERNHILAERYAGDPPPAHGGVGYTGLLRVASMWGIAISQGCAIYSLYFYLSWLPDYLETARHLSIMRSGVFAAVPLFAGAVLVVLANWIGDAVLDRDTMRAGKRRMVVVACLVLTSAGMLIPFVDSLALVVLLTILPISFSQTVTATNAALTADLLRSPADAGRAFAVMVLGGNVFGLLAPIVTGYIVQATGSFNSAFVLAGCLALFGALVSLLMTRQALGEVAV
jgi:ACS family glucarate transporter-like MFS transporter